MTFGLNSNAVMRNRRCLGKELEKGDGIDEMKIQDTGRSFYIPWDGLDALALAWARKVFGDHANGEMERDGTACYIAVHGLQPENYERYKVFYEKYDSVKDYDPEAEFETGELNTVFPETVTLGILNEELSLKNCIHASQMIATYSGVFFLEKIITE